MVCADIFINQVVENPKIICKTENLIILAYHRKDSHTIVVIK